MSGVCFYHGETDEDLRPYGPGGADVCFPCAMESPEREETAKNAFMVLLEGAAAASPDGVVGFGTPEGPQPLNLGRDGSR